MLKTAAFYRNYDKLQVLRNIAQSASSVDIYSCSGNLLRRINWGGEKGAIKGLGWSEDEKLIIVTADGTVRCYADIHGDFTPFSLEHGAEEHGVLECRFWSTGFVAMLGNKSLVAVSRYSDPRPRLLASSTATGSGGSSNSVIHSWTVIPPSDSLSRSVEVLLGVDSTVMTVDASDRQDHSLTDGPFRHISVSSNGQFVALYTNDGKIWVVSGDFQMKLSEYDPRAKTQPKEMKWCGSSAVVLAWEDEIHLVGPNGAATK